MSIHLRSLGQRRPELAPLADALEAARDVIVGAAREGKILAAGNGGSCADALHFSGELLKSFLRPRPIGGDFADELRAQPCGDEMCRLLEAGIPVVALGQNPALHSAYLNDRGDARAVLAQECAALARPGDALVVFSTSGEADNLLWAMAAMRARGGRTIAFTARDGGRMGARADIEIRSPAATTAEAQEHHIVLYHTLAGLVEDAVFG
ncbi:MAG: SIS domain-containing protein [Planctomycetota bacterium]|nr:SIS domain-containing protein [Planctomycetota bacterium]